MKKVIAIVGMPGSGKSEAGVFFKEKGIPVLRFGTVTDEGLQAQRLSLTEENEKPFEENLRKELGMAAFAIKMQPKIFENLKTADIVVLDGLRSTEEHEYLEKKLEKLIVLALYAPPIMRYKRLAERKERTIPYYVSRKRDIEELNNLHMGPSIVLADYLIKNEKTKEDLHKELEKFLEFVNTL